MIEVDPKRFVAPPFTHQLAGTKALVKYPTFALFDEMGTGKSKQTIDAACALHESEAIDAVVVVTPASVRNVWADAERGQLRRHAWPAANVVEYHAKTRLVWATEGFFQTRPLTWFVTNYEYLRGKKIRGQRRLDLTKLNGLLNLLEPYKRVMLVLDESSYLNSNVSQQFQTILELRKRCARCVILNGTPDSGDPLNLWAQLHILNPRILGRLYDNFWHFRASVAIINPVVGRNGHVVMAGNKVAKQIVGYRKTELERVQKAVAPWCLRRLKTDCLDLPPKLGGISNPIFREIALTKETWRRYRQLRDELLMTLPDDELILEPNAGVRIIRLAQLTGGFVGVSPANDPLNATLQENLFENQLDSAYADLSSEKLDWTFDWLNNETAGAVIVWCRFRRERERLAELLRRVYAVYELYGGQKTGDRNEAIATFSLVQPAESGHRRRVLIAQPRAGGLGIDLTAAAHAIYFSNDTGLRYRLQSEDRNHRQGQTAPVTYVDALATGPEGQQTIDHIVFRALCNREELSTWLAARWRKELMRE